MKTITNYIRENLFDINNDTDILIGRILMSNTYNPITIEKIDSKYIYLNGGSKCPSDIYINQQSILDPFIEVYQTVKLPIKYNGTFAFFPNEDFDFRGMKIISKIVRMSHDFVIKNLDLECDFLSTQRNSYKGGGIGNITMKDCDVECNEFIAYDEYNFPRMKNSSLNIKDKAVLGRSTGNRGLSDFFNKLWHSYYRDKIDGKDKIEDIYIDDNFNLKTRNITVNNIILEGSMYGSFVKYYLYGKKSNKFRSLKKEGILDSTGDWLIICE